LVFFVLFDDGTQRIMIIFKKTVLCAFDFGAKKLTQQAHQTQPQTTTRQWQPHNSKTKRKNLNTPWQWTPQQK
jgi:hypothetical protein